MSVVSVVFSRDRPAQLDLLLRSLAQNAPGLCEPLFVLWQATGDEYAEGYAICEREHPEAVLVREGRFAEDVADLLPVEGAVSFFTDDSVFFQPLAQRRPRPEQWLNGDERLLCFSLRLGENCVSCYSLGRAQTQPSFLEQVDEVLVWAWASGDGDFGYPGSLDGHVFRAEAVRALLADAAFHNPNTLEQALTEAILRRAELPPRMASYRTSHLVGVPVNRVNDTHPNRFGDAFPHDERLLNDRFLAGARLDLHAMGLNGVTAAHVEARLAFA